MGWLRESSSIRILFFIMSHLHDSIFLNVTASADCKVHILLFVVWHLRT